MRLHRCDTPGVASPKTPACSRVSPSSLWERISRVCVQTLSAVKVAHSKPLGIADVALPRAMQQSVLVNCSM